MVDASGFVADIDYLTEDDKELIADIIKNLEFKLMVDGLEYHDVNTFTLTLEDVTSDDNVVKFKNED